MLLFKKFSLFVLVIIINLIQEKLAENQFTENSTEVSFEGLTDIPDTTVTDENQDSTTDSTFVDRVNPPIYSTSTKSSSESTALSSSTENASSMPDPGSTPLVNTSTTVMKVEPVVKCNVDGTYDDEYQSWPPVEVGQISLAKCPNGHASWKCLEPGLFDPDGPDFSNCTDWLDELENISDLIYLGQAIELIEFISNQTVKNDTIKESVKLSQCLDIISKVQTFVDNANDTNLHKHEIYANNVFETFTHIMDQKQAWGKSNDSEKANLASKILIGTQSSIYTLSLQQNSNNSFVELLNHDFYVNAFYTNSSTELKFPVKNPDNNFSSIIIPPNTSFINSSVERNTTAIGAIIRNLNHHMSSNFEERHEINSDILSFSFTNSSERLLLNQDVIITLKHKHKLRFGDQVECVFWDFNQSMWSSEGCHKLVNQSNRLYTVCRCNHLTNFAALMDVQGRESKTLLKSLLTYFCSIISIVGLMFTINLILRSKNNSRSASIKGDLNEMRSVITCNLCICLLITNILVIAGMERTDITWLCQMSSALLLYSLLSSFSWMLMEGYYLYKSLVACFNTSYKTSYLYLLGYGLPIGIFVISFIVIYIKENILLEALFDQRYNYFCWISSSQYPSHIWILIGPAVCVIVCNCILMYISLRTAFKILRNKSSLGVETDRTEIKFKQILSFVFILFMLGITWLSFLFYIHQFFTSIFVYVFIVLNGSQGFFIFLYHLSIYDFKGNRRADSVHSSQSKLSISGITGITGI